MQDYDDWLQQLKTVVTKLHSFSSYLFYMGIIYIAGSVTMIAQKSVQLFLISQMHTIPKGNN